MIGVINHKAIEHSPINEGTLKGQKAAETKVEFIKSPFFNNQGCYNEQSKKCIKKSFNHQPIRNFDIMDIGFVGTIIQMKKVENFKLIKLPAPREFFSKNKNRNSDYTEINHR